MPWDIQNDAGIAIVTMNSSKMNLQNPDFFRDFHQAMDQLDQASPNAPLILTAQGKAFSAGLDFAHTFPMMSRGDELEINSWFAEFRGLMLRLFKSPRMTIAAINGHSFAGGLIMALCCDFRIAADNDAKFSLNEVPIGVAIPYSFVELISYRIGTGNTSDAILSGQAYNVVEALERNFIQKIVPADKLVPSAVALAKNISPDCLPAYAESKKSLTHIVLKRIDADAEELDRRAMKAIAAPESLQAQQNAYMRLKKS